MTLVTTGATGAFADKAVGNDKPVTVSGLTLAGTDAGNYTLTQPTLTANITPAVLAISGLAANSKVYDGTTAAAITGTPVPTGIIGSDTVSVNGAVAGTFADKAMGNNKPVTVSGLTLAGTDAGNYILTQPSLSANITPAPLTVTGVTATNKVYDGTTSATINTAGATLNGVLAADTGNVTLVTSGATGAFADKSVGAGKLVTISGLTLSGSAAGNYTLTQPTTAADIIPSTELKISNPALVGHNFSVAVSTALGPTYTLEYKNTLADAGWKDAETLPGTGSTVTLADSTATNPARFYRVRVQ